MVQHQVLIEVIRAEVLELLEVELDGAPVDQGVLEGEDRIFEVGLHVNILHSREIERLGQLV